MPAGAEFYNKAPRAYNERLIQLYDIDYKESVLVGYRWYETKGIAPLYPFGFGLSYTTFELSKPRAPKAFPADKPLKVSVTLTNTGDREGAEVVQLYVTENAPTVLRPKKELKGFRKVTLAPGKSAVVEFELDRQALAFWDTQSRGWKVNRANTPFRWEPRRPTSPPRCRLGEITPQRQERTASAESSLLTIVNEVSVSRPSPRLLFFCLSLRIILNYNMQSLVFSPIPEQNPIEAYGNMRISDGFISVSRHKSPKNLPVPYEPLILYMDSVCRNA